jgi:hypothetical protein
MRQGITKTLIFYGIGLATTWLTYIVFGQGYAHGPGLYIVIPILTILIGLFWTGSTIFDYYFKNKTDKRKGIILTNIIVFVLFVLTIFYIRHQSRKDYADFSPQDQLTTSQYGDSTLIEYNGTLVYLKIKDSVYVDKQDSLLGTLKK